MMGWKGSRLQTQSEPQGSRKEMMTYINPKKTIQFNFLKTQREWPRLEAEAARTIKSKENNQGGKN